MASPRVALAPDDAPEWIADAIVAGGGRLVAPEDAEVLVWFGGTRPEGLAPVLERARQVRWVQLPWAGVEPYMDLFRPDVLWTCGKGMYAEAVAEHALALILAGFRRLPERIRARSWGGVAGRTLHRRRVTVLGGGGITRSLLGLLQPFSCEVTVLRRHPQPLEGAARVVGPDALHEALAGADVVVVALALTLETEGIVGAAELAVMGGDAWLVNVARGRHVDTGALVEALAAGQIAGAALDVTDPEPLPDGHPLWEEPRCIITPHTADSHEMSRPHIEERIRENVRRYAAGEPLLGVVDLELGY